MGYAFISYSSKNQQMADSVRELFNRNGIETWMAPGDIPFGETYMSTINKAIKGSSCFTLLLSESAQGSKWVPKETERAVNYGKTVFTFMLDDVPMNDDFEIMLSTSQAIAIRRIDDNDENIQRLLTAVRVYTGEKNKSVSKEQMAKDNMGSVPKEYKVGTIITFGEYQDKPIDWQLLFVDGDKALIISKDILVKMPYNAKYEATTWTTCSLQKWLNNEFINTFYSADRQRILFRNRTGSLFGVSDNKLDNERFFLLGEEEANRFFKTKAERIAQYNGENSWWWLCSPGEYNTCAATVDSNGEIHCNNGSVSINRGVRPACWIDLSNF